MPDSVRHVRRLRSLASLASFAALTALGACASPGGGARAADPAATPAGGAATAQPASSARTRRRSNVITAAEIAESRASTVLNAIELLRPTFLRSTNPRFPVAVFVNGTRRGGLGELRNMRADEIETITRLNASDAQTRYGPDLLSGVLDIVTKPGRG